MKDNTEYELCNIKRIVLVCGNVAQTAFPKYNSQQVTCHKRKSLSRTSPDVLTNKSGSLEGLVNMHLSRTDSLMSLQTDSQSSFNRAN